MWHCTGGTGMICQVFDTTQHYHEKHNMVIEKRDRTLSEVILSERQQKQCCIEGILLHERTQKRTHVNKWVKEDDYEIREHW